MTAEEHEELVANLMRVRRTGKTYYFFMCPKGEDDAPVLLVERKAANLRKAAKLARRKAKIKIVAMGLAMMSDKQLLFVVEEGALQPAKMKKLLVTKMAKVDDLQRIGPLLRRAEVIDQATYEEQLQSGAITRDEVEDSDFEALYSQAEELMGTVSSVLGGTAEFGKRVSEMLVVLHRAADVNEGGDAAEATKMVERVIKAGPAMLKAARKSASEGLPDKFGEARKHLQEAHGKGSDAFQQAFQPLDKLKSDAFAKRKADRWQGALDDLVALDRALDDVLDAPIEDSTTDADDLDALLEELEEDTTPLEDFAEVSKEDLVRIAQASRADVAIAKGITRAAKGLEGFIAALLADEELVQHLGLDGASVGVLRDELPDGRDVVDAVQKVLKSYGDQAAFQELKDAVEGAFDDLTTGGRLMACEQTDLGNFAIIQPLEDARDAALAALS